MKAFYYDSVLKNWYILHESGVIEKLDTGGNAILSKNGNTIGRALVTDLYKDKALTTKYANWDDLDASTASFFVKAGGGISSGVEVVNALGYTPEDTTKKGAINGYAPLDSGSKVPTANLPSSLAVGAIENSRSQSTGKAPSSKILDDFANTVLVPALNLYDKDSMTISDYGVDNNGIIGSHSGWKAAKIPVKGSTQYSFIHNDNTYSPNDVGRMVYIDSSGNIISSVDMYTLSNAVGLGGKTFTTPSNCAFVYKNVVVLTHNYLSTFQLQKGASTTAYELFNLVYSESITPSTIARKIEIDSLVPISIGVNKFDKSLIINGKYIAYNVNIFTGINNNANSSLSGYQKVLPNTQYTLSGVKNNTGDDVGIFLDSNYNVLNGGVIFRTNTTFTTPSNCVYVLFVIQYNNVNLDYSTIQLELGAARSSYQEMNLIGGYPVNAYSNWRNKKILWMGTSIPMGNPSVTTPYPNIAASLLGAYILNVALSGSLMRISKANGTQSTNTDYHTKNFARTKQEFQDLLSQFGVAGGSYTTYPSYTQTQIDSFKLNSYEEKLLTHTDCDLFVFDFSWNDYMCDSSDMGIIPADITSRDRSHQWGAFNYCIDKLLTAKPNARFLIVGYWADYQLGKTNDIHKALADYWCVPYLNLAKSLGWSNITNPGTGNPIWKTFCPDGIHPQSDTTGVAEYEIGRICAGLINQV